MEIISAIITIGTLIYHIVSKISESSSNRSSSSYSNRAADNYVLSRDEKLNRMDIDSLNIRYKSTTTPINSIHDAERALNDQNLKDAVGIKEIIRCNNCVYIKVMYAVPYNSPDRCYSTSFAVNYLEPNESLSVYGSQTRIQAEELAFKEISNQLVAAFST